MLALQRYMMVTKDRQFPLSTPLSTFLTLIFVWTYSFVVSIPPILGWGTFNKNSLQVRLVYLVELSQNVETSKYKYENICKLHYNPHNKTVLR